MVAGTEGDIVQRTRRGTSGRQGSEGKISNLNKACTVSDFHPTPRLPLSPPSQHSRGGASNEHTGLFAEIRPANHCSLENIKKTSKSYSISNIPCNRFKGFGVLFIKLDSNWTKKFRCTFLKLKIHPHLLRSIHDALNMSKSRDWFVGVTWL